MRASHLAGEIQERLLPFCWEQWAQMGVLAARPVHASSRVQDPEALIVLTLEIARADPRLFDEVLDWTASNERLLSLRRVRALCVDRDDAQLIAAAVRWLGWENPRDDGDTYQRRELFSLGGPIGDRDPAFASVGLLRPQLQRSEKSLAPDLTLPINLSLRMRAILGVGIRAEILRIMLAQRAGLTTAAPLARTSTYSKRNVHDALGTLTQARVIDAARIGGELRYTIDPSRWAPLLGVEPDELPGHREWGTLFGVLRVVLRWSRAADSAASDYMRSSGARQLLEQLAPDLAYGGVPVSQPRGAEDALEALGVAVGRTLDLCGAPAADSARQRRPIAS